MTSKHLETKLMKLAALEAQVQDRQSYWLGILERGYDSGKAMQRRNPMAS